MTSHIFCQIEISVYIVVLAAIIPYLNNFYCLNVHFMISIMVLPI